MSSESKMPAAPVRPPDRVIVFDTTLRDGEQSPGFSMNLGQKLRVARALQELGVDVIEAGFAVASPGDLEAIQGVSRQIEGPIICSLSRCTRGDIEASWKALQDAPRRRCHVFLATSPIHRDFKLKMAKEEIVRRAVEGVKMARERFDDVEFSTEDAARTELDFLAEVVEAVIEAGATTVNIPDTVGYAMPATYAETLIRTSASTCAASTRRSFSVHCHNDLGLAVANSLAGVAGGRAPGRVHHQRHRRAGRQRLAGGGRHGPARPARDVLGVDTGIRTEQLYPTSRLVAAGHRHPRAAQQGHRRRERLRPRGRHPPARHAQQPRRPTRSCARRTSASPRSQLVLGKHSGRHALQARLVELGYRLTDEQLDKVFADFKLLADKKKEIYDDDLEALVIHGQLLKGQAMWELAALSTTSGTGTLPAASISLVKTGGERFQDAAAGDGPVDAVFKAIEKITGIEAKLRDYRIQSVTVGEDAQGEVSLEVEHETGVYRGRALSTDVIEGSARAFLDVVNRIALRIQPEEQEQEAKSALGRV